MIHKNILIKQTLLSMLFFFIVVLTIHAALSQSQQTQSPTFNVCCERTTSGAWCQNTQESHCDPAYRKTPTSCDATSFCKLGCCVDSDEGLCMKNTPQRVCKITTGTWLDDSSCNVQQCSLGCCVLGDQASFVTLTRCKRLSRIYGLETNFKSDITNEVQCILLAQASDKGACVYDADGERTCKFTTRQGCTDSTQSGGNSTAPVEFFKDYLCTADELATNCGPTQETICLEGKDETYFKDTCGNPANIYDANRIYRNDPAYWQRVYLKSQSCNPQSGNTNSKSCGNCDYLKGSICGKGSATYGDFICRDLNCYTTKNGKSYKNGESWCESIGTSGNGEDPVGNRYFRHVCVQGEELIEPCADFRNEVCIEQAHESSGGGFVEAACRINRWTDCLDQQTERDCLNTDRRDCMWISGLHYDGSGTKNAAGQSVPTQAITGNGSGILAGGHICMPRYPPGLEFWNNGNAKSVCSLGNSRQVVKYTTNLFGTKTCKENCEVTQTQWITTMNRACINIGDCGAKSNIAGVYTDFGIAWRQNGKRKDIQTGLLDEVQGSAEQTQLQQKAAGAGGTNGTAVFNK